MADFSSLTSAFDQANQAAKTANNMAGASASLPDMLRQAIAERFNDPLQGQRETASQNVLTSPTRAREYVTNLGQSGQAILSPAQQESIIAARRAADVVPLQSLNDMLQARFGGINDTINNATNQWGAMTQAQQGNATLLQQQAESAFDRMYKEAQLNKSSVGSNLLANLLNKPTEPKPTEIPTTKVLGITMKGQVGTQSPEGQWEYTKEGWQPRGGDDLMSKITPELLTAGVLSGEISSADASLLGKLTGMGQFKTSAEKNRETLGNEKQYNLQIIDDLIKNLTTGGVKTGPFSGLTLQAKAKSGIGINDKERQVYNTIAKIAAKQLFSLGGKTLPAQEMARLEPFTTGYNLPTEQNIVALEAMKKELENIYGTMIDNQSGYEDPSFIGD